MLKQEEQTSPKTSLGKILIIEDNPDYQTLIKKSLLNEFDIIFESNAQVGLEITKNIIPSLLIFNVQALKVDADIFLKLLRNHTCSAANIILILLTDTANEECYMLAREYGVYIFTLEWLLADKLSRLVKGLLDLKSFVNNQS
ncbi:hypothetical protein CAL7716_042360 [Calothrix sp. PCC 7716]|nr:hypothetical protein CAL7716_042360 [Calothrix sp. PCC 7716]